jgi:tetratricopeptide (TPR) repeat protein
MTSNFVLTGTVFITTMILSAVSATADDRNTCFTESGDVAIPACTRAITSGQYRGRDLAAIYYNRGIENGKAYFGRGIKLGNKSDFDRAIADYSEAIRLDPSDPAAYNNRCYAYARAGQLQLAIADCNQALRLGPNANRLDTRGFTYLRLGQFDSAIADYDEAVKIDPKLASSLYGRGLAKLKKGNTDAGNADIAAAMQIQSNIAEEFARYGVNP